VKPKHNPGDRFQKIGSDGLTAAERSRKVRSAIAAASQTVKLFGQRESQQEVVGIAAVTSEPG
jgi:hypothetical protein